MDAGLVKGSAQLQRQTDTHTHTHTINRCVSAGGVDLEDLGFTPPRGHAIAPCLRPALVAVKLGAVMSLATEECWQDLLPRSNTN